MAYTRFMDQDENATRRPSSLALKLSFSLSLLCCGALAVILAYILLLPTPPRKGIVVGPHVVHTLEHGCRGFLTDTKSWANLRTACRRPAPRSVLTNSLATCIKLLEDEIDQRFGSEIFSESDFIAVSEPQNSPCYLERQGI
ncbi:hypothetical protein M427DRAFT_153438 [Gonapodya prolifera JEL478]|uniref:Uncharacterized protein n=1 Tax=Gonapodya prolifera (strain JEL478) TaxID=1344416 RepID=A0A139AN04_GONPJ|nr:hypothetical protein M427DRAFT_153438 [Gonapodya prolifera JEL478]|eukprot:KXS17855.1 hypothetical protein M427DRAFT_153438 [Gonapodya prolifera JEL478]